jgi:hypothetical protein
MPVFFSILDNVFSSETVKSAPALNHVKNNYGKVEQDVDTQEGDQCVGYLFVILPDNIFKGTWCCYD